MTLEERANSFNQAYEALKVKYGVGIVPALVDVEIVQTKRGPQLDPTLALTIVAIEGWNEPAEPEKGKKDDATN